MRPFRLRQALGWGWEVGCNICGHTTYRHDRKAALHRLAEMALRSRIVALPIAELAADRDILAGHVDALAEERDELTEERNTLRAMVTDLTDRLGRAEQSRIDLRAQVKAAYEPVDVGECRKIRHVGPDTATQHAISIAAHAEGEKFNVYECRVCPPYRWLGTRPFHVGHCRFNDPTSLFVERGVVHYTCGCRFGVNSGVQVWACSDHAGQVAS